MVCKHIILGELYDIYFEFVSFLSSITLSSLHKASTDSSGFSGGPKLARMTYVNNLHYNSKDHSISIFNIDTTVKNDHKKN